jgi:hypothetical protein
MLLTDCPWKHFQFFKVDRYAPVYVDLKHFMHIIDKAGYYIHMNFTAENLETKAEKVFFAELLLPYKAHINEYTVTACDIIGPESLGKINYHYYLMHVVYLLLCIIYIYLSVKILYLIIWYFVHVTIVFFFFILRVYV